MLSVSRGGKAPDAFEQSHSLNEWISRYKKNRQILDSVTLQTEHLRNQYVKAQRECQEYDQQMAVLNDKLGGDVSKRAKAAQEQLTEELALQRSKNQMLHELRRQNRALTRQKEGLAAEYNKKYGEWDKKAEDRQVLEEQLQTLKWKLEQVKLEKEDWNRELNLMQKELETEHDALSNVKGEVDEISNAITHSYDQTRSPLTLAASVRHLHSTHGDSPARSSERGTVSPSRKSESHAQIPEGRTSAGGGQEAAADE